MEKYSDYFEQKGKLFKKTSKYALKCWGLAWAVTNPKSLFEVFVGGGTKNGGSYVMSRAGYSTGISCSAKYFVEMMPFSQSI